ncbi:PaaI family thioesterase [Alloiococcus sp. CFN-8]|uniref:PaaI family thioesterase n=1 Tax=Alloiococcus sp. CFN-8 TaxID=3416081 RepID=UPI003CF12E11
MDSNKSNKEEFLGRIGSIEERIRESLKGALVEDLIPTLISCDFEKGIAEFKFFVKDNMRNSMGIVHGGIISTLLDNAMGMTTSSLINKGWTPTVNLQVSFLKPVKPQGVIHISVKVISSGRTFINTAAELWSEEKPERVLSSATGIFYIKE